MTAIRVVDAAILNPTARASLRGSAHWQSKSLNPEICGYIAYSGRQYDCHTLVNTWSMVQ